MEKLARELTMEERIGNDIQTAYDARIPFIQRYRVAFKYYFGFQLEEEDKQILEENKMDEYIDNQVRPYLRQLQSFLTAKKPNFLIHAVGSDDRLARDITKGLFTMIYKHSYGYTQVYRGIRSGVIGGLGLLYARIDKTLNYGKGHVVFEHKNPLQVLLDPFKNHPVFDNMKYQIVFDKLRMSEVLDLYDDLKSDDIKDFSVEGADEDDYVFSEDGLTYGFINAVDNNEDFIYLGKYYYKERVETWKAENLVNGEVVFFDEDPVEEIPGWQVEETTKKVLKEVHFVSDGIRSTNIKIIAEEEYDIDTFLLSPFMDEDTENPYGVGESFFITDYNKFLSKAYRVILDYADLSANPGLFVQKTDDVPEIEEKMKQRRFVAQVKDPNNIKDYRPSAVPDVFYNIFQSLDSRIKHQVGLYAPNMGDPTGNKGNYSETLTTAENGMERTRVISRAFEVCMQHLGGILFKLCQIHYDNRFTLSFIDDDTKEQKSLDINSFQKDNENNIVRDIRLKKLNRDIVIEEGSYMPTNKVAQAAMLKELLPLADETTRSILMKKILDGLGIETSTFNEIEKVTSLIPQLQSQMNQMAEQIKGLEGENESLKNQLFTADRRVLKAQAETEIEKQKQKTIRDLQVDEEKAKSKGDNNE